MIALNIDVYGTYARVSAAADFAELWVAKQRRRQGPLSKELLADWLQDLDAADGILRDHFKERGVIIPAVVASKGSLGAESEASLLAADRVFAVLEERASRLGDRYPFTLDAGYLDVRSDADLRSVYMACLYISVLHSYAIDTGELVITQLFESFVEAAFISRNLMTGGVSAARRNSGSFEDGLVAAGQECGIRIPGPHGVYRIRAQDEGVDVIARVDWQDDRPLHWIFLVQATCGASNTWSSKMGEAGPDRWRDLLGLYSTPRPVLAVPHHLTTDVLSWLTAQKRECLVLDRVALSSVSGCSPIEYYSLFQEADQLELAW